MTWQTPQGEFLIRGRACPIYLSLSVYRVRLPDGTLINSAHEYFRVSAAGQVLAWYRPSSSSALEDCLYAADIHVVLDATLYTFLWIECYGREGELDERSRLPGLCPIPPEELPFDAPRLVETFDRGREDAL